MPSFSLIVFISSREQEAGLDLAPYRDVLEARFEPESVEIILAGRVDAGATEGRENGVMAIEAQGGEVEAVRAAIKAATGDIVIVLDPRRSYPPRALVELIEGLDASKSDLAVAVPRRSAGRSFGRAMSRRVLGLGGQAALGTSDVFSGLMAVHRAHLDSRAPKGSAVGSRIVMDLLAWAPSSHVDVPVDTGSDDRTEVRVSGVNDLRQLKRLLDHRFGTFSRLVQFCIVGASGMVVDLTLYALLQAAFRRIGAGVDSAGVSWSLATARALAILVAMVWNFTLNRRLTFNDSREGSIARQLLTYAMGNALGILVSLTLSLVLPMYVRFFNEHRLAAAVVGIVMATGISFSMSRWVVFIRKPDAALPPIEEPVNAPSGRTETEPAAVS
ncbi:GtrA-like protein [Aquisphaera giovannonii]|uniref:GtrA-like protein n=1 Tax=Aquisphaera giovannonii TaxID=406548 RepID=A0A5B9W6W8_9BACT|nr:GtrA family protein [Aquisphaera giovannonii]QEH36412.1 GtrA-like protein [Aquisphaera giovannonii]